MEIWNISLYPTTNIFHVFSSERSVFAFQIGPLDHVCNHLWCLLQAPAKLGWSPPVLLTLTIPCPLTKYPLPLAKYPFLLHNYKEVEKQQTNKTHTNSPFPFIFGQAKRN